MRDLREALFTKYGSFSAKRENFHLSDEAKETFTEKIEQANPNSLYSSLDTTACAAFVKESRMKCAEATKLHRKFGDCEVTVNTENETQQQSLRDRASSFFSRSGRRVATAVAIVIAVSLGYHVIFGANGLSAFQQKRNQDQTLKKEILQLQQENSRLQDHVQHLQSDPNAIEHEARVILRYAKPGEVIYALNDKPDAKQAAK
jgi:cell division protein FtsB